MKSQITNFKFQISNALRLRPSSFPALLDSAIAALLVLLAVSAPHSIAATQTAWILALVLWVVRFFVGPRPRTHRTPVDYALLAFFIFTFISALASYEPDISVGKLRAASLFTVVYVVCQNVRSLRAARVLAVALVASCALSALIAFGEFARGRGVKVTSLAAESPLRAAGVREGDTILEAEGGRVETPEELETLLADSSRRVVMRWPNGQTACVSTESEGCVVAYRAEVRWLLSTRRAPPLAGETSAARLGILGWTRGRDERADGTFGHFTTYAEVLQLVASLALGLLVALPRKRSLKGALLAVALAVLTGALILTVTRASWLGLLLSSLAVAGAVASRRVLLVTLAAALPLAVAGLLVLQQRRQVGFLDPKEGSTAWRLTVYREGVDLLARSPRHLAVGVGMDSIKRRHREWHLFDDGRLNVSHFHSVPLQLAVERGLPTLAAWLALVALYARMLWRMARRRRIKGWVERGLALGALGGLVGFLTGGLVHWNLGDSEVVTVFYLIMGLALAVERLTREESDGGKVFDGGAAFDESHA
ncbi:MAG TPA: O-antigen ligase family protein, partial [Pyrinomonadaceae bacterium]|nr:O-antigen ligase family protein [Pyrinomonadaceae bacterium]